MPITIYYLKDKNDLAQKLGYPDYVTAIQYMYVILLFPLSQIAKLFGISWEAVRANLVKLGVKMRPRGGANNVRGVNGRCL